MDRRTFARLLSVAPAAAVASSLPASLADEARAARAGELVIDMAVTTGFFRYPEQPPLDFRPKSILTSIGVACLGIGELTPVVCVRDPAAYEFIPPKPGEPLFRSVFEGPSIVEVTLWELDALHRAVEAHPSEAVIALEAQDIVDARQAGKLACVIGLDSGTEINNDLRVLSAFERLGLRKLALVHAAPTAWAGAVSGELPKPGLQPFGEDVIRECNRLSILVDVSHASDQTFWDAIKAAKKPLVASHSGARQLSGVTRNLTDEMLKALAENGGVVGVCGLFDRAAAEKQIATGYYKRMLQIHLWMQQKYPDPFDLAAAMRSPVKLGEARKSLGLSPEPDVPALGPLSDTAGQVTLTHLDYIVQRIGFDHVGIGSDLNMTKSGYAEFISVVTAGLIKRNYKPEQIRKILSGNFLRVFRDNEART